MCLCELPRMSGDPSGNGAGGPPPTAVYAYCGSTNALDSRWRAHLESARAVVRDMRASESLPVLARRESAQASPQGKLHLALASCFLRAAGATGSAAVPPTPGAASGSHGGAGGGSHPHRRKAGRRGGARGSGSGSGGVHDAVHVLRLDHARGHGHTHGPQDSARLWRQHAGHVAVVVLGSTPSRDGAVKAAREVCRDLSLGGELNHPRGIVS